MDTLNEKYNIEITVLSPLSIGVGADKDLVKGLDFVVKNNKAYLLNMKKMIRNGVDIQSLTTYYANKDAEAILKKVEGILDVVSDKQFDRPVNSDNDIKSFVKNELSGKPIIPGSSLKGAVRSVILDYLLAGRKPERLKEKDYFGDSTKGDELMRFIKFSDAEFDETALVNIKIFNLYNSEGRWRGGWKHSANNTTASYQPNGFNTLYESVLPEQKGICSIMLSKTAFDRIKGHIKQLEKEKLLSIKELFKIINQHTQNHIAKEIAFFSKYPTDNTEKIIECLEQIQEQIPNDHSACVLKMSAGSGFHSITGDWQYDDYTKTGINNKNGKHKYKSRKIAVHGDCFSLMGFVMLQIISEEEIAKRRKVKEEEERQKAAEKQAAQEKNEQKQKQLADYNNFIQKAHSLFDNNQLNDAKSCLEQAQTLIPDGKKHDELLANINKKILEQQEAADREQAIHANLQKEEADRLTANQVPLTDKLKTSNKIPTMVGQIKTWMKLNNIQSLSEADMEVTHAKVKEIYDSLNNRDKKSFSLKPLSEIISEALINQWSNEIKT